MSGFVTDKMSSRPVEGATVIIIGDKAKTDATTDSDGAFVVGLAQGVKEGKTVRLRIEKAGYKTYEKLLAVSSEIPLRVPLEPVKGVLPSPPPIRHGPLPGGAHAMQEADPDSTGYLRSIPHSIRFDTPIPMYLWITYSTTNIGRQIMPGALIFSFIRVRPQMSAKEEDDLFGQFNVGGGDAGFQTTEHNYWEAGDSKVGMEVRGGPDFKTVDGFREEMDNMMDGTTYIYFFVRHLFFDKKAGRLATETCFYFKGPDFSGPPHECHGHNGPAKWPGTK